MTSSPKRFLDPELLRKAACEVVCNARRENVGVALIGGYALQAYGSPRLTGDIDFVAAQSLASMSEVGTLSFGGVKTVASNGVPVDLVVRTDDYEPLYEAALEDATTRGGEIPVVRPEYLAAMKMAANRPRDQADLDFLIGEEVVNVLETRALVRKYLGPYAAEEFDQIVMISRWRREEGQE